MKPIFTFTNPVPSSKSIVNRLLICKSYFPSLQVIGENLCQDVVLLQLALQDLKQKDFFVGDGGTSFRFLALRLTRAPGTHHIHLGEALQKRPHDDLLEVLTQLKADFHYDEKILTITGKPWDLSNTITVNQKTSTQFLTSLLLNAWALKADLNISGEGEGLSTSYITMTKKILHELGMQIEQEGNQIYIPAGQHLQTEAYHCEIDMSSAFVIACLGAIHGGVKIQNFKLPSLQGDSIFLLILQMMGVVYKKQKDIVDIFPCNKIRPIQHNLKDTPDLFPVLAIMAAFADGSSKLFGAPHLKYKESNRIQSVASLLTAMNIAFEALDDGMIIHGKTEVQLTTPTRVQTFNDHRVAFAAALAKVRGYPLIIEGKSCVNKSFPEFWSYFPDNFAEGEGL